MPAPSRTLNERPDRFGDSLPVSASPLRRHGCTSSTIRSASLERQVAGPPVRA